MHPAYTPEYYIRKAQALKRWMELWVEVQDAARNDLAYAEGLGIILFFKRGYDLPLPPFDEWWKQQPEYFQHVQLYVNKQLEPAMKKLQDFVSRVPVPLTLDGSITLKAYRENILYTKAFLFDQLGINIKNART